MESGYWLDSPNLLHNVQTDFGAHSPTHPMLTGGDFPGFKVDHSQPPITEVKNGGEL
jgi:hypothetical protein